MEEKKAKKHNDSLDTFILYPEREPDAEAGEFPKPEIPIPELPDGYKWNIPTAQVPHSICSLREILSFCKIEI
jgi:hypothetical protein